MTFDYLKSMEEGHGYNEFVADLLRSFGVPHVYVPEFSIATTHDEIRDKTANEKDIVVDDLILEVKSSSRRFEDQDDFPYSLVLIDTVHGYDNKIIKPFAYVFISQMTKGLFAVPVATKEFWTIATIYDNDRQIEFEAYFVAKRYCRPFIDLVDVLLQNAADRSDPSNN